jgi:hypothetical protein
MPNDRYCNRTNVESCYGVVNVNKWADLDKDANVTTISSRVTVAIQATAAQLDDKARVAHYAIPITATDGTVPTSVRYINARLAGVWLWESSGSANYDKDGRPIHQLQAAKDSTDQEINEIFVTQRRSLDARK